MTGKANVASFQNIDYAMVAKAHTSMYLMHKWWARKPHNVVSEYIKHYTKEGDIVLDPFCGSGVTPIEAIKLGRKGIGIDLDTMAAFIARMTAIPVNVERIISVFEEIGKKCEKPINELYYTKCKKCKNRANILATIWSREKSEPTEIRYYCNVCKERNAKKPDESDLKLIRSIEKTEIPYWFPKTRLFYDGNGFLKKEKSDSIQELFTKRNIIALSIIFNEIEKIPEQKIRDIFRFAFTSMVHLSSRMCPVAKPGGKGHWGKFSATSFWALQSYWVPPTNMESNVWMLFESAINGPQGIVRGKSDSNSQIKDYKEAKSFKDIDDGANIMIKTHNALELSAIIPDNSIDYVFTDPPYGGAVQYFELSTLWASWLKMNMNYKDEITINNQQDKNFEYYHKMLRSAFKEVYRVLKPGKYLTVTFHSTEIQVWNSIIKAVAMVGFDLEKIVYQPPARTSAKGLLQPYGSAVGDYYIRFRKPENETLRTEKEIDLNTYEMEVVDAAKRIIGERGEPTMYQHILNGIMVELKGGRNVPVGAKNIEDVLKENIGREFELIANYDDKGKVKGKKWWLKGMDLTHFSQPTLSDRVERVIVNLLERKIKVSFDDVLQSIFIEFPNALTPDTQNIKEVLEEYAEPTKDGNWMLKQKVKIRESEHSEMIYYLASLGEKMGFDVWIGLREQGESYKNERLSSLITKRNPVWRFIPTMNIDRIKQIDVIWHEDGRVRFEFEVENTTAITEAIVRGSNIPHENTRRLIVIPEERESLLFRKMKEPMLNESITKNNWKFLFYRDVKKFYEKSKKSNRIESNELEKLFKLPKEARQTQSSLKIYI